MANPYIQRDMDTALSLDLPRDLRTAMLRSLRGRCPNCGAGKLMKSYLKQVDCCAACGESLGQIRADDAPPWLTILLVGHIVIPFAMTIEAYAIWPEWAAMVIWPAVAAAMSMTVLPRAKALFIAIIWATRAPGFI